MKRHEALAPLSREHHAALILSRLLRNDAPAFNGLPKEPVDKAAYAVNMYKPDLNRHFHMEESMLERIKSIDPGIDSIAAEIIAEHRQLTGLFLSLATAGDLVTAMDTLGRALEQHIRKEERVLFPLIQEKCSEEVLKEIQLLFA